MIEIIARPDFVGLAAAPLDPIFESQVGRIVDSLGFLQRRADDAAAAAGDRRRAAAFRRAFQNKRFAAGAGDFDGRRYTRAAAADDRNIGFDARISHNKAPVQEIDSRRFITDIVKRSNLDPR